MRILATSDIHGDKELVERLSEEADEKEVDLVVICGDLTEFERDLEGLIGPFKGGGKQVLLIPGNHESPRTVEKLAEMYKPGVKALNGDYFKVDDAGFFGAGSQKALKYSFERIKDKDKKIMIVHPPPHGTKLDELRGRHVGSPLIRKAIEEFQPDLCLCGHIHENWGKTDRIGKTQVINVGKEGTLIEL